jgi:aryl-alcohol dehydrogenase-like predicted oxidoreductase
VTAAITGSRSGEHLRANAAAGDRALEQELLDEIEALLA